MIKRILFKIRDRIFGKHYRKMDELQRAVNRLQNHVNKEMRRRDIWKVKDAEVKRLAKGKKILVIKSPEPDSNEKFVWGEYNFARALKREFEKLGYYVVIEEYENWYCEIEADIVVVLRGPHQYRPDRRNEKCKYILWHLTHPETMEKEEYELYDMVYVNSISYAKKMQEEVNIPVQPLLVCVDTDIFFPQEDTKEHNIVFVGNTRRVKRNFVFWCEKNHIPLKIWGEPGGWRKYVKEDSCVKLEGIISNSDLPDLYRKSKIVLNDHFEDMRQNGFMNNRLLETLCCGCVLLSDYHPDYEETFGESVIYYHNEDDFIEKFKYINEHYEDQKRIVLGMWPKLREEFSFENRAVKIIEDVVKL